MKEPPTAPTPDQPAPIPGFHGRDAELAWLRGLFEEVAARRVPRLAVIVAESGIGKTRLVQALYQQLTVDPTWDPPEQDYWPDAFQAATGSLKVNPDLAGHTPQGPPKFMWLGMRWQDPGERNVEERLCPIPEARDALRHHIDLARHQLPFWKEAIARGSDSLNDLTTETLIDAAAEATGLPFVNILKAGIRTIADTMSDRHRGFGHHEAMQQEHKDAGEAFIDTLAKLCAGRTPLPTILWLDDAQWIDHVTLQMLSPLFEQARRQRWPLLIVATHWEREWRQGCRTQDTLIPTSLAHFERRNFAPDGVDPVTTAITTLDGGSTRALQATLQDALPGLTTSQAALLIDKAAGNFLTMVENIGELRKRSRNFVDRDFSRPLSEQGEQKVRSWESDRERRVQQRFDDLEEEVRDLLGWGSHIGQRFIADVVVAFAADRSIQRPSELLTECVDPSAILSDPNPYLREFRDRAFHRVASLYFQSDLTGDTDGLTAILQEHLVRWTNASFDDAGDLLPPPSDPDLEPGDPTAPAESIVALEPAERTDLLLMAVRHLPIPAKPDWDDPAHQAALRARCFLTGRLTNDGLWEQVREEGRALADVEWSSVPSHVYSIGSRWSRVSPLLTAGALDAARKIAESVLSDERDRYAASPSSDLASAMAASILTLGEIDQARGHLDAAHEKYTESLEIRRPLADEFGTPKSFRDVSLSLNRLGDIDRDRGDLDAAHEKYTESLEIARRLAEELDTPQSFRNVSLSLGRLGDIGRDRGDLDTAHVKYTESLEIARRLADELGTPESFRDVSVSLDRLGNIDHASGDLRTAYEKYTESLKIRRCLVDKLDTPESFRDVSVSLDKLGKIDEVRGHLDAAYEKYAESLEIARRLADGLGTPESFRDLSVSLDRLGDIDHARGDLDAAHEKYTKSLEIARRLANERGIPQSFRDVSVSLDRLGDIDRHRGDLDAAHEKYTESLEIRRRLADELGIPESFRDVSVSLIRLGDIDRGHGDLDAAREKYAESLEIRRRLADERNLPESFRDVSVSLDRLGNIDKARGHLDAAHQKFSESLGIRRGLANGRGNPDVSVSLNRLGDIARARGEFDAAIRYKAEELAIDLEWEDAEVVRETYASAIEMAEAAGDHEQAAAWRAELAALREPSSDTTTE